MALPTVHFTRIPPTTNGSLHSIIYPALHALLIAAGWTLIYADADAIGTGSSSNPAWDKTPATTQDAGIAIYRMPANDHSRQWFVRLRPYWGASTNYVAHRFQVGTGESGGSLTGAGTERQLISGTAAMQSVEVLMNASEDGFSLTHGNTWTNISAVIERAREFDGEVTSHLATAWFAQTGNQGSIAYRASDGLEHAAGKWRMLGVNNDGTNFAQASSTDHTTTDTGGENSVALGPFPFSARLWGLPRLWLLTHITDAVAASDHPVSVDGGVKLYYTLGTTNFVALVARE